MITILITGILTGEMIIILTISAVVALASQTTIACSVKKGGADNFARNNYNAGVNHRMSRF